MKIFSFFAGVGMLDLGFQEAGYEVVFVNEYKQEFILLCEKKTQL